MMRATPRIMKTPAPFPLLAAGARWFAALDITGSIE
jgi:hypothetical protein